VFLSEETPFSREGPGPGGEGEEWCTIRSGVIPRLALVLPPGSRIVFPPGPVPRRPAALVTFGAASGQQTPGPRVTVRFRPGPGPAAGDGLPAIEVFSELLPPTDPRAPWAERRFRPEVPAGTVGSFEVESAAGPAGGGKLALYEFVVSEEDSLDLDRARAFRALRLRNEKANFDAYYKHALFQEAAPGEGPSPMPRPGSLPLGKRLKAIFSRAAPGSRAASEALPVPAPAPAPNAFTYAHNMLLERLALTPPAFGHRLATRAGERRSRGAEPLRVLSLCSGEARIESDLVRNLPAGGVHVTLLDMNPDLLQVAARRVSRWCPVERIVSDVNESRIPRGGFDVILCVSGLHHVVELEHLFDQIAGGLREDGEFWSIGETVGRNGGRMWPDSYAVANEFFAALPEKYRMNRMTGRGADPVLPDLDYSVGCFEGIRCESIEPVLLRRLEPVDVCRHNCILWKLFSPTYSDNYDTSRAEDRELIEEALGREIALFRAGGRPIELNGVYRLRL
jgi:SAM-dependent methyltransferase